MTQCNACGMNAGRDKKAADRALAEAAATEAAAGGPAAGCGTMVVETACLQCGVPLRLAVEQQESVDRMACAQLQCGHCWHVMSVEWYVSCTRQLSSLA